MFSLEGYLLSLPIAFFRKRSVGGIVLQMNHGIDGYMAGFTESLVQDALNTLVRGRTTFIIAHRIHTIRNADRIVLLRNGRIERTGSHEDLLLASPYYASLVRRQMYGISMAERRAA